MKKELAARLTDWLILVFLIGAISLGVVFFRRLLGKEPGEEVDLTYRVRIAEIDDDFAENLDTGVALLSSQTKQPMGTVFEIERKSARRAVYSEELGRMILAPAPGKQTLTLTLRTKGVMSGGISVGGKQLYLGEKLDFRCAALAFSGEVISVC